MRRTLALLALLIGFMPCAGCQTAEFSVNYPVAGVYVAAKFEAKDDAALATRPGPNHATASAPTTPR
ncbi:MAG TPA: hypothetical protein VEQ85_15460 [Lacipirellulaceae bacterium]|nr:hypothetical protein [Lacipirellulaceae bacterium]